jgi:hypothetical protein
MKDKSNIRRNSRIIPTKDKNDFPCFYGQVYDYNIKTSEERSVRITFFYYSKAIVESETKGLLEIYTNHTEESQCVCLKCYGHLYNEGFCSRLDPLPIITKSVS